MNLKMACETLEKVHFVDLETGDLFIGCDEVGFPTSWWCFVIYACIENGRVTFFAIDDDNRIFSDIDFDPNEVKGMGGLDFDETVFLCNITRVKS